MTFFLTGFRRYFFLIGVLFFTACDLFEYSPNQIVLDDDEKDLNAKSIAQLQAMPYKDTLRIILMGDTQRFYDETAEFVASANKQEDIDLVIHAGDISDFGFAREFKWVSEIMSGLKVPHVTVVGNHDLLVNGPKVYKEMFGPFNFSFSYSGIKFIFFDNNSREYNFNGLVPDLDWISKELEDTASFKQAVLVSHIPPFSADTDPKLEKDYTKMLSENGKVSLSLHGHQHSFSIEERYEDGITYAVSGAMDDRGYLIITLFGDAFNTEKVLF